MKHAGIDHEGYVPPTSDMEARPSDPPPEMTPRQIARVKALKALLRNQWPGRALDLATVREAQADPDPASRKPWEPTPEPVPLTPEQIEAGLSVNPPMTLGRLPESTGPIKPTLPPEE